MCWCEGQASNRPCPEDKSLSVGETFQREQPKLLSLPDNPYPVDEQEEVKVGKTPYVRFDLNDYSVPHQYVCRTLSVRATLDKVTILEGANVIAHHQRSHDKWQQIEDEAHIKELASRKKQASQHRGQDRLSMAVPCASLLLQQAAIHGYHLASITKSLLILLDDYGAVELEAAIEGALEKNVPHPNTVRIILQHRRKERNKLPPVKLDLPDDDRIRHQRAIRPHTLNKYDALQTTSESENNDK